MLCIQAGGLDPWPRVLVGRGLMKSTLICAARRTARGVGGVEFLVAIVR